MEKRISVTEFQSIKNVAKACNPLIVKRDKIREKINALQMEYDNYNTQVQTLQSGILQVFGFGVEELVKKVVETTDKTTADGTPIKITKYLPTDIVSYDIKKKQYVIFCEDTNDALMSANEDLEVTTISQELKAEQPMPLQAEAASEAVVNENYNF